MVISWCNWLAKLSYSLARPVELRQLALERRQLQPVLRVRSPNDSSSFSFRSRPSGQSVRACGSFASEMRERNREKKKGERDVRFECTQRRLIHK